MEPLCKRKKTLRLRMNVQKAMGRSWTGGETRCLPAEPCTTGAVLSRSLSTPSKRAPARDIASKAVCNAPGTSRVFSLVSGQAPTRCRGPARTRSPLPVLSPGPRPFLRPGRLAQPFLPGESQGAPARGVGGGEGTALPGEVFLTNPRDFLIIFIFIFFFS